MAGIGFELKKILSRQTFFSELQAYIYAAMVSSGPWLMSIITLAVLGVYKGTGPKEIEHQLFRSTIVYTYAFSLVYIGFIQLIATRYLADRFYNKKINSTMATFLTCSFIVLFFGTIFSGAFYYSFKISFYHKFCGVLLFLVVNEIWLSMIFLSAIKDYNSIVFGFFAGSAVSIGAAIFLSNPLGTDGFLTGYLLGQIVILFCLLTKLLVEFPPAGYWDWEVLKYIYKYWRLSLTGIFFNLAIWIDKMVFWIAPDSRVIVPWFRTHDLYEGPIFFAYLTIVPTLALFLLKIETVFYTHYKRYYTKVSGKKDLASILAEKDMMIISLKENLREVLIIQGCVTILCIIFAPGLAGMTGFNSAQVYLLRVALIGAFLHGLLSINIIILFYFDLRNSVLIVSLLFFILNFGFTLLTIKMGFRFYGYGYMYACLITLITAYYLLDKNIKELEYVTFAKQKVQQEL